MAHATKQDMLDRYDENKLVELTDRADIATGEIVNAVMDKALTDATEQINSYLAGRYRLPLSATPGVLITHACIIAYYKLHRSHYPEEVRKEYEDTLKWLESVARGTVTLDAAGSQPQSAAADARVEGPERIFSRDSMKVY